MKLSESLNALLLDMRDAGDPIARAIVRRNARQESSAYWSRHGHVIAVSLGYQFRHSYPTTVRRFRSLFRRLSPTVEIGDYFTFREKNGLISYCPRGRDQRITADGKWERSGRQDIKPAKWARSVLSPRALHLLGGDAALSVFAARFAAAENATRYSVEKSTWDFIYSRECMQADYQSCMWDKPVGAFYSLTDAIPMLVKKGGKPVARFIFWPSVVVPEGGTITLADRIYGSPEATEHVITWARENGHYRKSSQSCGCRYALSPLPSIRGRAFFFSQSSLRAEHLFFPTPLFILTSTTQLRRCECAMRTPP